MVVVVIKDGLEMPEKILTVIVEVLECLNRFWGSLWMLQRPLKRFQKVPEEVLSCRGAVSQDMFFQGFFEEVQWILIRG